MAKLYYDKDADLSLLKGKTIAIIGYGSQGHAHALNLKDAGFDVVVGLYRGSKSWEKAKADGLKVMAADEAASAGHIVMILIPDQHQRQVYAESIVAATLSRLARDGKFNAQKAAQAMIDLGLRTEAIDPSLA